MKQSKSTPFRRLKKLNNQKIMDYEKMPKSRYENQIITKVSFLRYYYNAR